MTLDVPSFVKSALDWIFILLVKKIWVWTINFVGFNFSSHFCQVSEIYLNIMQQYLTHLEKTTIVTSKKIHCNVFYPPMLNMIKHDPNVWRSPLTIYTSLNHNHYHLHAQTSWTKTLSLQFVALMCSQAPW